MATREAGEEIDPMVLRSWERCLSLLNPDAAPPLNPTGSAQLVRALKDFNHLIEIARPEMEDLFQYIEGSHAVVTLVDANLYLLDLVGDPKTERMLVNLAFKPGVCCSEKLMGTNAFALAHREGVPACVVGPEHYLRWFHSVYTAAAPLHDRDGRIVALLGLAGPSREWSGHVLGAVLGAARSIEVSLVSRDLFTELNQREAILQAILDTVREGIVVWNAEGRITKLNAEAARQMGVDWRSAVGEPIERLVSLAPGVWQRLRTGHEVRDVTAKLPSGPDPSIQHGDQGSETFRISVRPLYSGRAGQPVAFALVLNDRARPAGVLTRVETPPAPVELLGESPYARRLRRAVEVAKRGRGAVVIEGEIGLSREGLARSIHLGSERRRGPWVVCNCRALPPDRIMGELLGSREGPGSGSPGYLLMADQGTLYLESPESLPKEAQSLLLSVARSGRLVGPRAAAKLDVRLIVSTTRPLRELVRGELLLKEFAVALDCFHIELLPLRQRSSDLPAIMDGVLQQQASEGLPLASLTEAAQRLLIRYAWPGNTLELAHVLEQAALLSRGGPIEPRHLPGWLRSPDMQFNQGPDGVLTVEEAELQAIIQAGLATRGRVTAMAELLGISRTTLWRRMRALNIDSRMFKASAALEV